MTVFRSRNLSKIIPNETDQEHLRVIRASVTSFLARCGLAYGSRSARLLDVAPQDHEGARSHFPNVVIVETIDINPDSGATYVGDITKLNECLVADGYDFVVCTEVLEHTLNPFAAIAEIQRILKPSGLLMLTVPFNFRIHGPLPDCWRFTEHGLRSLLSDFDLIELSTVECPGRPLMPIHYRVVARKDSRNNLYSRNVT